MNDINNEGQTNMTQVKMMNDEAEGQSEFTIKTVTDFQ